MVFDLFGHKKRVEKLRLEVQDSFSHVKKDINKVGDWIRHLDDKKDNQGKDLKKIREELGELQTEIEEIKNSLQFLGRTTNRQAQTTTNTQTMKAKRQTDVQTNVQTEELERLTVMERAVVWALLNSEMKLSHEDISTLLGKDKSTIRGQINAIKQKIPGIINEVREPNGKKRVFIEEEIKKSLVKRSKLKVKT